ncbi:MAG: hypothetical protein U0174_17575 [Polyangiaceae bacterium]
MSTMWDKLRTPLLALSLAGILGAGTGCAGAAEEDDPFPTSEDEIQQSVGEKLAGVYANGEGALTELTLERKKVNGRYSYDFTAKQRVMCVRAPCPALSIKGKWFANKTVLSLDVTGPSRLEYRYKLTANDLSLRDKEGNELARLKKQLPSNNPIAKALKDFGISKAQVDIPDADVKAQEALSGNRVKFEPAFRAALQSFLNDDDGGESPLGLINDLDADDLPEGCGNLSSKKQRLVCLVNSPDTEIGILKIGQSAEQGETVKENWIFTMSLPQLSDHGHWAIVDRKGQEATYNYGFN